MSRMLMAWELGQNFGHVLPLLPVARALREAGHEVVFALKDLRQVGAAVAAAGFQALQAPVHPSAGSATVADSPQSMTDILLRHGYGDLARLPSRLADWMNLLTRVGADLLVASYAPTALLAARCVRMRTCLVGMPFELPPPVRPSPAFRPWLPGDADVLLEREKGLISTVNCSLVHSAHHGEAIEAAWEVFSADRQVLWTFPQLDPHAGKRCPPGKRDVEYAGAIFDPAVGPAVQWPGGRKRRVFGYLRLDEKRLRETVTALSSVGAAFYLVVPSVNSASAENLSTSDVTVSPVPVHLGQALHECDAVISYGSHGTICASLLAGKPLVLMPEQMADVSLSRTVASLGVAALADAHDPSTVAAKCSDVLHRAPYRAAAKAFQAKYAGYDVLLQAQRLATLLGLLAAGTSAATV